MPTRRAKKKPVTETKGEEFFSLPFVVFVKKRCEKFNILFMISPDRDIYRDGEPQKRVTLAFLLCVLVKICLKFCILWHMSFHM